MIEKKHLVTSGSVFLDPSGQRRPIFFDKTEEESKVQTVKYRLAAWRLGPTGQWCPMDYHLSTSLVLHPISHGVTDEIESGHF